MLIENLDLNIIDKLNIDPNEGITLDGESVMFQLPPLKVLFGISERNKHYSLALSLFNYPHNVEHFECKRFFNLLESKMFADTDHSNMLRESKNWAPYFNLKLPNFLNGEFITKIYYKDPNVHLSSPLECIKKGDIIIPVIECTGFWQSEKSKGANWDIIQIQLTSKPNSGIYKWLYE